MATNGILIFSLLLRQGLLPKSPCNYLFVDLSSTFKFLHNLLIKMIILSHLKCLEVNMNQNSPYLLS